MSVRSPMRSRRSASACPCLSAKDNVVINGEVAIAAARLLGLERVPCIRIGHLTESEQRVLRLAVNRLAEKGQWDLEALKIEFNELILDDAPIEISGFAPDEIDTIVTLDPVNGVERGPLAPEPGAAAHREARRYGSPWAPHRSFAATPTDPAVLRRLMAQEASRGLNGRAAIPGPESPLARLVLTDEPYNVPIAGNVTNGRAPRIRDGFGRDEPGRISCLQRGLDDGRPAASRQRRLSSRPSSTGGAIRPSTPRRSASASSALNLVVWAKANAGQGSLYRSQHELLPLYRKGDAPHVNNVALGRRGRWRSNVWTYPGASSLGSEARRGLADHPTVKPTAMLADALIDLTHRGDIVIDPFLGVRLDADRRAQDRPHLPWRRTRSDLCRRHHSPLRGGDRREGNSRRDRRDLEAVAAVAGRGRRTSREVARAREGLRKARRGAKS